MNKIKRVIQLMVALQTRNMSVQSIAKELQVTVRTAYRYLKIFNDMGVKLDQTKFGQYTIQPQTKKRPAKRTKKTAIHENN